MTQTIIKVPAAGAFDPSDITLTDDTSGALLIKEGSNEYMRIDTTNGSEQIVLKGRPGSAANAKLVMSDQPFLQGSDQQNIQMTSSGIFANVSGISGKRFQIRASGTNQFFEVQRTGNVPGLRQDADSTFTYTLDDGSGAAFKVVNDAGSPKTFFSIADGGDITLDSESVTLLKAQGHQYLRLSSGELQIGATGKFNVMHTGTPMFQRSPNTVSLGATSTTTIVNIQTDGANKSFKLNPSTTSQTFTFEFQDGTSSNGGFVVEQHFVIQNYGTENCTIQATITSGRGSALGKDLSAGGSTSGELVTGMTLNAGKSAIFKAIKWNKEINGSPAASGNEFMFQTIMVEA